ncbi:50S ribosomal protein L17 [Pontibacter akesuensis]|uniref:Large ribosomal subunit protein bL17 n=1 Tax=Pontibacter akesuensis TaxID=388950 RepID=A0A1I7JHC3_9BACT|nr:50S ribosomal protein L17 [Pontibacter akesuensis]GHA69976.1 50S ribosomal protein L17 [Pontibacter akesuensis]SFU84568.1 LSU ribosomal protein L17P [Pontibacter akesuensis]
MRHGKKFNHLGRTASHRKAMLSNMASSLIVHKRVSTTVAKAKALRKYVEPLLTKAKSDTTHSRRTVFAYLQDKESVKELFDEVSTKIANRPGGYTRIIKTGYRLGDNAEMCVIELVDYNEDMLSTSGDTATGAKRTRRRGGKKKSDETTAAAPAAAATETPAATEATEAPEATDAPAESNDKTEDTKDAQ